jgi:hypothetical protein
MIIKTNNKMKISSAFSKCEFSTNSILQGAGAIHFGNRETLKQGDYPCTFRRSVWLGPLGSWPGQHVLIVPEPSPCCEVELCCF